MEWLKAYGVDIEKEAIEVETPSNPSIHITPYIIEPRLWPAWSIFKKLSTQWNIGMAGATGLKGEVLLDYLKLVYPGRNKKARTKRLKTFDQIILISRGALDAWQDQRDTKEAEK